MAGDHQRISVIITDGCPVMPPLAPAYPGLRAGRKNAEHRRIGYTRPKNAEYKPGDSLQPDNSSYITVLRNGDSAGDSFGD